jgi:hypothetical protein
LHRPINTIDNIEDCGDDVLVARRNDRRENCVAQPGVNELSPGLQFSQRAVKL